MSILVAALTALAVWLISVPVMGVELRTGTPGAGQGGTEQAIGVVPVLLAPVLAGLAAWGLLAILERVLVHGRRIWRLVGIVVLALSLLGPIGLAATASGLSALLLMHLLSGIILIVGLSGWYRRTGA